MSIYSTQPKSKDELKKQLDFMLDILEEHIETAGQFEDTDARCLEIAKTELQTGFMWFKRGLTNDATL